MSLLAQLILDESPAIIALIKSLFAARHPNEPVPTSEEVIAAYETAFAASRAKDDTIIGG